MAVSYRRGHWVLDFRDGFNIRRCIQTEFTAPKDKPKAEKELAHYLAQIDQGKFTAKRDQKNFAQLTEAYLEALTVREFTKEDYESVINTHLRPFFGNMKLRDISPQVIEEFRGKMRNKHTPGGKKTLSVRTVNKSLTTLSQMLNYAERHRWIESNPNDHVVKLKQTIGYHRAARDGEVLLWSECERLFAAAQRPGVCRPGDAELFRMAVETGMRQGELLGLKWCDIDGDRLHIRQSARRGKLSPLKTASSLRTIGLTPTLVHELRLWRLRCPRRPVQGGEPVLDLVFPTSAGTYQGSHNLRRRGLHRALKAAGLKRIKFHSLRHSTASLLLANGVGIKDVQATLGHSSAVTTLNVYSHLLPGAGSPSAEAFHALSSGGRKVAGERSEAAALPDVGGAAGVVGVATHGSQDAPEASLTAPKVVAINNLH